MNKTELILRIAEETGFSRKNVELGLNAAINLITKALTEGSRSSASAPSRPRSAPSGWAATPRPGRTSPSPPPRCPSLRPGKP